jgi:ATP-binding cassette subfamily F protein 3
LLLDELTNHLDLESREAVEDALVRFPGTVMFITHDRSFVEKLADEVLVLKQST